MSEKTFYLIDPVAWDERTYHLPLDLEAAYLRLSNFAHQHGRLDIRGRWAFQGMFRCGATRARSILRRLADAEMIWILGEDHIQVRGVRLTRSPMPVSVRAEVYARDGFICAYCATTDGPFEIDHIAPVVLGGTDDPANLCVACAPCNRSKGAKTLEEWTGRA